MSARARGFESHPLRSTVDPQTVSYTHLNQVYTGLYRFRRELETVKEQTPMDMGELIGELNARGERVIFLGDGVPVYRAMIEEKMTAEYDFAPPHVNRQRAASVAALGAVYFAQGKTESAAEHVPDYLRKSQACLLYTSRCV